MKVKCLRKIFKIVTCFPYFKKKQANVTFVSVCFVLSWG
jgi:hypothetical protein